MLKESKLNQYDVLVRNDRYWGEKPQIEKITVKVIPDPTTRAVAFETGDIDLLYGNEGAAAARHLRPLQPQPGLPYPAFPPDRDGDAGAELRQSPHQRASGARSAELCGE